MKTDQRRLPLVLFLFFFLTGYQAHASDDKSPVALTPPTASNASDTFTFYWENDAFTGTDRDYTNGIKLTWSTSFSELGAANLPAWSFPFFEQLPFIRATGGKRALSLSAGQDMFTPEDTGKTDLIEDDRPYAGYTYLATGFHTRRDRRQDTWEVRLGIVGPASLAEEFQNLVHDVIDTERAQGWDNQLDNELVLDLICESQWRLWSRRLKGNLGVDMIPHLGGRMGTVKTYMNGGVEVRIGWNLLQDFGSCPIRGGCETNTAFSADSAPPNTFHFFLASDAKAVARDIFLDGNTFSDSHSVDKKPLVGELMAGVAWQTSRVKLTYSFIYRTKQFETQGDNQTYGSLSLGWSY